MASPVPEKLAFYTSLFRARRDAYAKRWENSRLGTAGWSPAVAGGWRKPLLRPDRWERSFCMRPWCCAVRWTCARTTACSRTRTSCPTEALGI
ncbi:TOTE conflict system archaeo-eukaryotic primase domain-containing protein [Pseudosporangium ferrugineum]|uniref:TOTE conflict system archaeo-eukaryotic primase domain-containing protein n=1 Tax=Pseudosporangium ferrugineum TaxID=439699 RepID=UPI003CCBB2BF